MVVVIEWTVPQDFHALESTCQQVKSKLGIHAQPLRVPRVGRFGALFRSS